MEPMGTWSGDPESRGKAHKMTQEGERMKARNGRSIVSGDNVTRATQGTCPVCGLSDQILFRCDCGHLACEGCFTTEWTDEGVETPCDLCLGKEETK